MEKVIEYILQLVILMVSMLLMQYLGGAMHDIGANDGEIIGAFAGLLLAHSIISKDKKEIDENNN